MIENYHIIAHAAVVVVFILFILYSRRRQPHVRRMGKSEVRMFEDQIVPGFDHWQHVDKMYVANLAYTLLKLDLACPEDDKKLLGFSREWVRDQFVRRYPPTWRGRRK